jgi:hypothetical protein
MGSFKGTVADRPESGVVSNWLLSIEIADGKGILKLAFNFLNTFFNSPMQRSYKTPSASHAIRNCACGAQLLYAP